MIKIETKRLSIGSKNKIDNLTEEILIQYSKDTFDKGNMYFVAEFITEENCFVVYEYEENDDNVLKINLSELPENTNVNSILRKYDSTFILDEEDTELINSKINEIVESVLKEQNNILNEYRKEEHVYIVTERINESVFLKDITEDLGEEIEEVDFPEELLEYAFEGKKFKYINEKYELID